MSSVAETLKRSRAEFEAGKHSDALKILGEMSFEDEDAAYLEGSILNQLGLDSGKKLDQMFTFLLASVESYSRIPEYRYYTAVTLFDIAERFASSLYYKKSRKEAKLALGSVVESDRETLDLIIHKEIDVSETRSLSKVDLVEDESECYVELAEIKNLKIFWAGLSAEAKKDYLKVSISKMKEYFEEKGEAECVESLVQVLKYVKKHERWVLWICKGCDKTFSSSEACKIHLETEHKTKLSWSIPQLVSKVWLDSVLDQAWEADGDEERSPLLKNIRRLLVSLHENKMFTHSIRDVLVSLVANKSEATSTEPETLDSISLLDCKELNQILHFLRQFKCTRDDGANLVCSAVDRLSRVAGFRGKIDFSVDRSLLLLDKRLLRGGVERVDDKGDVEFFDAKTYYSSVNHPSDHLLNWLDDYISNPCCSLFPSPPHLHHISVWIALLRIVHFTCRILQQKSAKQLVCEEYMASLTKSRELFKDKSILCTECEKSETNDIFLCAVKDVIKIGEPYLTPFHSPNLADLLNTIERHQVNYDSAIKKVDELYLLAKQKVAVTESKIMLLEASRTKLVEELVKLSFVDFRGYIQHAIKEFVMAMLMQDAAQRGN